MKNKMSKQTNNNQFQKLVELMLSKPSIAQGNSKMDKLEINAFWEMVTIELNYLGPPKKDISTWKKVWIDYKGYIKKRLSLNHINRNAKVKTKTYHFNDLEEKVIKFLGMHKTVTNKNNVSRIQNNTSTNVVIKYDTDRNVASGSRILHKIVSPIVSPIASPIASTTSSTTSSNIVNGGGDKKETTIELLKTQINIQKQFYDGMLNFMTDQRNKNDNISLQYEDLNSNLIKIHRSLNRLANIGEANYTETKRHNLEMEKFKSQKIEIKNEILP